MSSRSIMVGPVFNGPTVSCALAMSVMPYSLERMVKIYPTSSKIADIIKKACIQHNLPPDELVIVPVAVAAYSIYNTGGNTVIPTVAYSKDKGFYASTYVLDERECSNMHLLDTITAPVGIMPSDFAPWLGNYNSFLDILIEFMEKPDIRCRADIAWAPVAVTSNPFNPLCLTYAVNKLG